MKKVLTEKKNQRKKSFKKITINFIPALKKEHVTHTITPLIVIKIKFITYI